MGQTKSKSRSSSSLPEEGLNNDDILLQGLERLAEPSSSNDHQQQVNGDDNNNQNNNHNNEQFTDENENEDENGNNQSSSYYSMIKSGYNELVKAIIRPPRADYVLDNLGPQSFQFAGQMFTRTDCKLPFSTISDDGDG